MKFLLAPIAVLALTGCLTDPVDVDLSYLEADKKTYETLSKPFSAMLEDQLAEPTAKRTMNPWTGLPFSDQDIMALEAVLESWELRLEGTE